MKLLSVVGLLVCVILTGSTYGSPLDPPKSPKKKITKSAACVRGHVICENEHIPFVTVTIKGTSIGVATDASGHYELNNFPEGKQTIVVQGVGYRTLEKTVEVTAGEQQEVVLDIDADIIGLDQVVVTADRNEKNRRESATIVNTISPKLFERTQSVTLSDGLNFTPGLRMENNCQNCGFTQVRMNGLEGPYSQILINSRPVFSGLAGVYGLELIPANMIERVEVVRGGGSAIYGSNAIAGTINLITKDPINNSYKVAYDNAFVGVGVDGNTAMDQSLNVNASIVSDDYRSGLSVFGFKRDKEEFDANNDGYSEISNMENTTIGLRTYYKTGSRSKLTFDYFGINESRRGGNMFDKPFHEADVAEAVDHTINTGAVAWDAFTGEHNKFSAYFSGQHINRDSYYGADQDLSAYGNTTDFTYSAGMQYLHDFEGIEFAHMHLTVGAENNGETLKDQKLGYYDIENDVHTDNTTVADQRSNTFGFYAQHEMKFSKTTLSLGFRVDHYSIEDLAPDHDGAGNNSGTVFSPRVTLLHNIQPWLQARASYSSGYRAPQVFDEDLHIETSQARKVIHENDPNLKQESSDSYSVSLDFTPKIGEVQTQIMVEGFYTKLKNPFVNDLGEVDENGVVISTRRNLSGAKVQGVNLEFNAAPSRKFQVNAGFTIQQSKYDEPELDYNQTKYLRTPEHYGYLSLDFKPIWNLSIALSANYTGSMLVPHHKSVLDDANVGSRTEIVSLNKTNSFFETGLKIGYDIELSKGVVMNLKGGVKNIFNSYQDDFDVDKFRDPAYIYGPNQPRTVYFGISFRNLL